jgi:DNA-binding CsgD family transcriptional regulator
MRHFQFIRLDSMKSTRSSFTGHGLLARSADSQPTPRELEVEDLLCRGYSQENIAAIFGRSISTISVHVTNLYRKRGVHTQVGLLLAYLERQGIFVFGEENNRQGSNGCVSLEATE